VEHLEIFGENRVFVKPKFHKGGKDTWDDVYEGSIGLGAGRLSDLGKVIILVLFDEEEDSKVSDRGGGARQDNGPADLAMQLTKKPSDTIVASSRSKRVVHTGVLGTLLDWRGWSRTTTLFQASSSRSRCGPTRL